jgi:hypothetical protein
VRVDRGRLRFGDISGLAAGGMLRGQVVVNLEPGRRSFLTLTLSGADARRLLAPFGAEEVLEGSVDVRLRTRVGPEWVGSGEVVVGRGTLFGIAVRDLRLPLSWHFAPGGRGILRLSDAMGQSSQGRLSGRAELTWGGESRLDGTVRFLNVDIGELLSKFSERRVVGGQATGRVTLGGRNLNSVHDVTATVEATLAQTQAFQMPVLRQLAPFVLRGQSANVLFTAGDFRATLAGGVVRIQRLALWGDVARVYVEGTVTLQQRLDLNVVAVTNVITVTPALARVLQLPLASSLPVTLLQEASLALANVTVRLHVGGTIRAPAIQFNPVPLLTEGALRFFLAPLALGAVGLGGTR